MKDERKKKFLLLKFLKRVNENHLNNVWILAIGLLSLQLKLDAIQKYNSSHENQLNKYAVKESKTYTGNRCNLIFYFCAKRR